MNSTFVFAVPIQILPSPSLDSVPSDALPIPLKCIFSTHYLLSLEQIWEQNEKSAHGGLDVNSEAD